MQIGLHSVYLNHKSDEGYVIALGNFDGIHLGHLEVIKSCTHQAQVMNLQSAIITFAPHPAELIGTPRKQIMSYEQKIRELSKTGIDCIHTLTFNEHMMYMQPLEFIEYLVTHLRVRAIITGYNFRFGHKRSGDINTLNEASKKFGYQFRAIGPIYCEYHVLSSSYIKSILEAGAIGIVNTLLGRAYSIEGEVVKGQGLAEKNFAVPTANILLKEGTCYPAKGVYLVKAQIDEREEQSNPEEKKRLKPKRLLYGIANIGSRPTFSSSSDLVMETHLLQEELSKEQVAREKAEIDFYKLYGKKLRIWPMHFIRPERQFSSAVALFKQIKIDIKNAHYLIKNLPI